VVPVLAQGFFEKICDRCYGKGWIVCPECQGTGTAICSKCDGKGYYYEEETCDRCEGSGEVIPDIRIDDHEAGWTSFTNFRVTVWVKNYEDTQVDFTLRVQLLDGTNQVKESTTRDCYVSASDTVKEVFNFESPEATNSYNVRITSVEKITCPECGGTGKISVKTTCEECGGDGKVVCTHCGGDGVVICPKCGGSGYVTDYTKIGGLILSGILAAGIIAFAAKSGVWRPPTHSTETLSPVVEEDMKALLEERRRYQKFIEGLKERVTSGDISEKTFSDLHAEYEERLEDTNARIDKMKRLLETGVEDLRQRKEFLSDELEKLKTRFDLGEIGEEEFSEKESAIIKEIKDIDERLFNR